MERRAPLGRLSTWLALPGVVLLAVGGWLWLQDPTPVASSPGDVRTSKSPLTGQPGGSAASVAPAVAERAPWEPGAPRRVVIPALEVDAPVVPIKAAGRTLLPPDDPQQLGWWSDGARPGDRGSVLITGHTVHTGGGALDNLETLRPADRVTVRTVTGARDYRVTRVKVYRKGTVARDAQQLFSQQVAGRLVLVTCENWNGVRYLSNVVVTARPA